MLKTREHYILNMLVKTRTNKKILLPGWADNHVTLFNVMFMSITYCQTILNCKKNKIKRLMET